MSLPYPPSISVPFGRDAVDPYIHEVPVPSQESITPGAASWATGFVPLNMTLLTEGGVPPFGSDINGVLNALSANLVWLVAGGTFTFNSDIVDNSGGYPEGAIIRSATTPSQFFYNTVDGNSNDPDSVTTGWIPFSPLSTPTDQQVDIPSAGTYDNVTVGKNVGAYDVDTTDGNVTITGITAGSDGQILTVTNTGPNLLTLAALNAGSASANRFRFAADLSIPQNDSLTIRYIVAVGKWLKL
jgi:hypothetical protein